MQQWHPELVAALTEMVDRLDTSVRKSGYEGPPVQMFVAGGIAVHFHCGTRYTEDVDASFSARLLVPAKDLSVPYVRGDGRPATLFFDANYNDCFALMHPDYRANSVEWTGIGNERRLVHVFVLAPLDLAVSKISRFSEQDHADILDLAQTARFTSAQLQHHAHEALDYYVGSTDWLLHHLDTVCREIDVL